MYIEFTTQPFIWYAWIPLIIWFSILFVFFKKWKFVAFVIPTIFCLILLQPTLNVYQPVSKSKSVVIDTSYPAYGIPKQLLKKVFEEIRKKNLIKKGNVKNLDQSILGELFFKEAIQEENEKIFQQKSMLLPSQKSNNLIITHGLNYKQNNEFVFTLPILPIQSAILDFQIDEQCSLKQICTIKVLVFSSEKNNVVIQIPSLNFKKKFVTVPNRLHWIDIKHTFYSKKNVGTFYGTIEVEQKSKNYPSLQNFHFLLSIKEKQPYGYFLYKNINIDSWRIGNAISKNIYLKTEARSNYNPLKFKKYKNSLYYILFVENITEISTNNTKLPVLYISVENSFIKNYVKSKNYKKINDNLYQKKNKYVCDINKNKKIIFYDTTIIEQCVNYFSQSIAIKKTFMPSQVIEHYGKLKVYYYGISNVLLLYNQIPIKSYYDFQEDINYYNIIFYDGYTLNIDRKQFNIQSSISMAQRNLFTSFIKESLTNKSIIQNNITTQITEKQIEDKIKRLRLLFKKDRDKVNINKTIEKKIYAVSFVPSLDDSNKLRFATIILILITLGILWYTSVQKKDIYIFRRK